VRSLCLVFFRLVISNVMLICVNFHSFSSDELAWHAIVVVIYCPSGGLRDHGESDDFADCLRNYDTHLLASELN